MLSRRQTGQNIKTGTQPSVQVSTKWWISGPASSLQAPRSCVLCDTRVTTCLEAAVLSLFRAGKSVDEADPTLQAPAHFHPCSSSFHAGLGLELLRLQSVAW